MTICCLFEFVPSALMDVSFYVLSTFELLNAECVKMMQVLGIAHAHNCRIKSDVIPPVQFVEGVRVHFKYSFTQ